MLVGKKEGWQGGSEASRGNEKTTGWLPGSSPISAPRGHAGQPRGAHQLKRTQAATGLDWDPESTPPRPALSGSMLQLPCSWNPVSSKQPT